MSYQVIARRMKSDVAISLFNRKIPTPQRTGLGMTTSGELLRRFTSEIPDRGNWKGNCCKV